MADAATQTVGFIGLGDMGGPLTHKLLQAGFATTVYDVRPEALDEAVAAGARRSSTVEELVGQVDVICMCPNYDEQVRDIFMAPRGILEAGRAGLVTIVHSTVLAKTVRQIGAAAQGLGIHVMDAPVSGNQRKGRSALSVMVGGNRAVFDSNRAVLDALSTKVFYVGELGAGLVAKLANNLLFHVGQVAVTEALRFAESEGLSREQLFEIVSASSGRSQAVTSYANIDAYGTNHTLAGTPELPHRLAKDLRLAVEQAQQNWVNLPLTAVAAQLAPDQYAERWRRTNEQEADER